MVFSGGGTGGHLYPALALADALRGLRADVRVFFVGASRGVEARVLPRRGEEHLLLPVAGFQRGRSWGNWRTVPALATSLVRVRALFRRLRPEAVVVTGGYAGGPAGLMAALMGIPLVLQEQNSVPGVTTRALSRWAEQIHVAFPEAVDGLPTRARRRAHCTGNPVRPVPVLDPGDAKIRFDLPRTAIVLLIVGGSQGSAALNRIVLDALRAVVRGDLARPEGLHVLWSTGPAHHADIADALAGIGALDWVRAMPYVEDMPSALAASDLAVSRAGAMATAELLNHGLPAILVPLPTAAADHQTQNARALAEAGAAVALDEHTLTGAALWVDVLRLAVDGGFRGRMSEAALRRAHPRAAEEIASAIAGILPSTGGAR